MKTTGNTLLVTGGATGIGRALAEQWHAAGAAVLNVSSGLAFVPLARTPAYCATKAAVHSWSLTLRERLKDQGIEVIELVPPAVQTDLMPGHATNPNIMT